jgi:hypothetical protein
LVLLITLLIFSPTCCMVRLAVSWWADSCTMCFRTWPRLRPIRPEWSEISHSRLVDRDFGVPCYCVVHLGQACRYCGSSTTLRGLTNDAFVAAMDSRGSGVSRGWYPKVQACNWHLLTTESLPVWIPVLMAIVLGIIQEEHCSLLP